VPEIVLAEPKLPQASFARLAACIVSVEEAMPDPASV